MSNQYAHYLSTEEAAQALGVSRRTLARYKSTGRVTPLRVNNKDMYSTDDIARFSATSESDVDKLRRQHLFNSARIVELEARLSFLESVVGLKSAQPLLNIGDVDLNSVRNTLHYLTTLAPERWDTQKVEDLCNDLARMSPRLLKKVADKAVPALELAYIHAAASTDTRAQIAVAMCGAQLARTKTAQG